MFLFLSYINAPFALSVIALTPASMPLCLSMTLPSVIGPVLAILTEGTFYFPLCILRPTREGGDGCQFKCSVNSAVTVSVASRFYEVGASPMLKPPRFS